MDYFMNQKEAEDLFEKLRDIADMYSQIFIVVENGSEVKPLLNDLSILLQDFPNQIIRNSLRIKGSLTVPSIRLTVIPDHLSNIAGIPIDQIIKARIFKEFLQ